MGGGPLGPEAALDAVFALYKSDAAALEEASPSEAAKSTPLWATHAESLLGWGNKEIKQNGLEGFFEDLAEFLVQTS